MIIKNKNQEENKDYLYPIIDPITRLIIGYELDSNSTNFKSDFDQIQISIAGPGDIRAQSKGEVKNTDTLNYKTLEPEKGGIFCPSIFGPTENYACKCRRYVGESYKGLTCERCNVKLGLREQRRLNLGHIELNTCVVHPWFYSYVCIVLQMTKKTLISIIEFEEFIFIKDTKDGKFKKYTIVNSNYYYEELNHYSELLGGGEAILSLLTTYDYESAYEKIKSYLYNKSLYEVSDKDLKRMEIMKLIHNKKLKITDVVINVIPVIPPDLRPILNLEGGLASSDINESYRKLQSRVERLKKLQEMGTHEIITNNEKYMIYLAVCQILGPYTGKYKTIATSLKGKEGFFRREAFGRRSDFSCRAVIVVGPKLKINECGIPINIAKEIFKSVAYSMIIRRNIASSILEAKHIYESDNKLANELLQEIIKDFVIILNRAPTLHKLSMQCFQPVLNNSNAIQVSPPVCAGFNADFDGDNCSAHFPLSLESRIECKMLLSVVWNLLLPINSRFALSPTKDIVVGLYYASALDLVNSIYEHKIRLISEAMVLVYSGVITYNRRIEYFVHDINGKNFYVTNLGRIIIWDSLSKLTELTNLDFKIFNDLYTKTHINNIISHVFEKCGRQVTIEFLNFITNFGFEFVTQAGISFAPDDMLTVEEQKDMELELMDKINQLGQHYDQGLITKEELRAKKIDLWSKHIEDLGDKILEVFKNDKNNFNDINNVAVNNMGLMWISGARGSQRQILQMCCIRGLMAKPSGEVSSFVIKSNLKGGLTNPEYFKSTHGERKGISDTSVKTSKSGYLSRKLIDVAHNVYVSIHDCYTEEYLTINFSYDKRKFGINYECAVVYKTAFETITYNNQVIIEKDKQITEKIFHQLMKIGIKSIKLRSVLFCNAKEGVCAKCYGIDLTNRKLVDIGTAVGILAAQSIGEPGTQLTMRTTHTGGIATTESQNLIIIVESFGIMDYSKLVYSINSNKEKIVYKFSKAFVIDTETKEIVEEIDIKEGSILLKSDQEQVFPGDMIATRSKNTKLIIATKSGQVKYKDMIQDITYSITVDKDTGITRKKIISSLKNINDNLQPQIIISGNDNQENKYTLENGFFVLVNEGQKIKVGDILAKLFTGAVKIRDITGGLLRIINIFEVKKNVDKAIIATHNGILKINDVKSNKKNKTITIHDENTNVKLAKFTVSQHKHIMVQDGQKCKKGDMIMDGEIYLQDMLDTIGYENTVKSMIGEISSIYGDQGVAISYVYFEIIIKKMTQFCIVIKQGESDKAIGSYVTIQKALEIEREIKKYNKEINFIYKRVIQGITTIALRRCESFISSASFQNTISRLADAAIHNKTDFMEGIKQNVVFGKLIPVGTGYYKNQVDYRGD